MTDVHPRSIPRSFEPAAPAEWLLAVIAIVTLAGGVLVEWFRVAAR